MGKRTVEETSLVAVADAIRERTGTKEAMEFPNGFVSAVEGLLDQESYLADVCNKAVAELVNSKIVSVPENFQRSNKNLLRVELPALLTLGSSVFSGCTNLAVVVLPSVTTLGSGNFDSCAITQINMPNLEKINGWGHNFANCRKLTKAHFPKLSQITGAGTFGNCVALTALVIGTNSVCTLSSTTVFDASAIANGTGYIYVPRALVGSYKSATNWSTYANQIRAIEDYPEICGG